MMESLSQESEGAKYRVIENANSEVLEVSVASPTTEKVAADGDTAGVDSCCDRVGSVFDQLCVICMEITHRIIFWILYLAFTLVEPILCAHYPKARNYFWYSNTLMAL